VAGPRRTAREPRLHHGLDAVDYVWDIRTASDGGFSIAVSGTTSFPQIDARVVGSVVSGVSVRADGSVATFVAERQGDALAGYRVFDPRGSDDRCSMTWRLTATRAP